jgi:hypothetical protein
MITELINSFRFAEKYASHDYGMHEVLDHEEVFGDAACRLFGKLASYGDSPRWFEKLPEGREFKSRTRGNEVNRQV